MTQDNVLYEPGIYLSEQEIERHAAKNKGNPILQQLLFLTQQTTLLRMLLRKAGDNLRPTMDEKTNQIHEAVEAYFIAYPPIGETSITPGHSGNDR